MENIYKLEQAIKTFFTKEILSTYTFDDWKNCLVQVRNNELAAIRSKWDIFGEGFALVKFTPDVRATEDEWDPSLNLGYSWSVNGINIEIMLVIVKNELRFVICSDIPDMTSKLGDNFDFENEFEKSVEILYKLKQLH